MKNHIESHIHIKQLISFLLLIILFGVCIAQTIQKDGSEGDQSVVHSGWDANALYITADTSQMIPAYNRGGEPQPVVEGINFRSRQEIFKSENIETTLNPRQQIEYMANMEAGDILLYSWEVNGKVFYNFHAHQENVNPDIWIRYSQGAHTSDNGNIVAPYTGEHGWYWVNLDDKPVTLKLKITGYYKDIFRVDL